MLCKNEGPEHCASYIKSWIRHNFQRMAGLVWTLRTILEALANAGGSLSARVSGLRSQVSDIAEAGKDGALVRPDSSLMRRQICLKIA